MSDCKCEHNNHGHLLLWLFCFALAFNSSVVDCSGEHAKTEREIRDLQSQVRQLNDELVRQSSRR